MHRSVPQSLFALALIAIFTLSLMPLPQASMQFDQQDKFEHLTAFAGLCLLGLAGWPRRPVGLSVGLLAYGLLIELAQSFTPHRQADAWDWLADALGIVAGLAIRRWLDQRRAG